MRAPLPIPPTEFMFLATAGRDEAVFLATGAADQAHVASAIERHQIRPSNGSLRILDWGCGCGRIARHWDGSRNVTLFGCDVAEAPVRWCQENLRFASFSVSGHNPPLPYPEAFFDVIYAASVLTHLTFASQFRWMAEIWRVLKPSGLAMLTTHGPSMLQSTIPHMAANMAQASVTLIDEEPYLCIEHDTGSNATGSLQTRGMTERLFAPFNVVEYLPRFGFMGVQDTNLFRKKRDGELVLRSDIPSMAMRGHSFQTSLEVDLRGATTLCLLVGADVLTSPAQITARIGSRCSSPVNLPNMAKWTGLAGIYASMTLDGLEPVGRSAIEIDVTSVGALDGVTLSVPMLIGY